MALSRKPRTQAEEAEYQKRLRLYQQADQAHQAVLERIEKRFKLQLWLSAFATIITPLSWLVIIPFHRRKNDPWYVTVGMAILGLIPVLSGILSAGSAVSIKEEFTPQPKVVRKIVDGTPDEVRARHQEKRRQLKEKYPEVDWVALKNLDTKAGEQKASSSRSSTKKIIDKYSDPDFILIDDKPKAREEEYPADEALLPGQTAPRRMYVPYVSPDPRDRKPKTAVIQDREKAKRWDFVEGRTAHVIEERAGSNSSWSTPIDSQKERPDPYSDQGSIYAIAKAIFLFFKHSRIGSVRLVAQMEQEYPELRAQPASPKA